jgi:hypothetical protein
MIGCRYTDFRRPGFNSAWFQVRLMLNEVALEQVSLRVLQFPPLIIIPPLLHTHLSPPHAVCDSPDQAAYHHTLGAKLGASSLTRHLAGLRVKVVLVLFLFSLLPLKKDSEAYEITSLSVCPSICLSPLITFEPVGRYL